MALIDVATIVLENAHARLACYALILLLVLSRLLHLDLKSGIGFFVPLSALWAGIDEVVHEIYHSLRKGTATARVVLRNKHPLVLHPLSLEDMVVLIHLGLDL